MCFTFGLNEYQKTPVIFGMSKTTLKKSDSVQYNKLLIRWIYLVRNANAETSYRLVIF